MSLGEEGSDSLGWEDIPDDADTVDQIHLHNSFPKANLRKVP